MTGRAKFVVAATVFLVVLMLLIVVFAVFNPLTAIDARFGRGKDVTELAEQIADGACADVPLRRSGNETSWLSTCAALADLIDEDTAPSITDRDRTTVDDPLGLANSTDFTYSFEVTDTLKRTRKLTIVVNADNKLVEAGVDRILLVPGDDGGYANSHRYTEAYGYAEVQAEVEAETGLDDARALTERVLSSSSEAECQQLFADVPSGHLLNTVNETDFVDLCVNLGRRTTGAELSYGPVRMMEPGGGGPAVAASDVTVLTGGVETVRISVGLELESGQWRLRSLFAEEEELFYRG